MEKYRFFRKFDREDLEGRVAGGGHSTTVSRFVPVSSKIDAVSTSFYLTMAVVKLSQCSASQLGLEQSQDDFATGARAFVPLAFCLTGRLGYFHVRQKNHRPSYDY